MTVEALAHISIDPLICHGQACIKGTRVSVSVVLECFACGMTIDEIVDQYPSLTAADIRAAAAYGAMMARDDTLDLVDNEHEYLDSSLQARSDERRAHPDDPANYSPVVDR